MLGKKILAFDSNFWIIDIIVYWQFRKRLQKISIIQQYKLKKLNKYNIKFAEKIYSKIFDLTIIFV